MQTSIRRKCLKVYLEEAHSLTPFNAGPMALYPTSLLTVLVRRINRFNKYEWTIYEDYKQTNERINEVMNR